MTSFPDIFAALAAIFDPAEVKSRPQQGRQLHYITARTVMNRLDTVLGPENWWDAYSPAGETSVCCALAIRLPDGSTVTKCDAGGNAGMADSGDDDKSGYSDAFKRAAVKFGVGRYLYRDGVPTFAVEEAAVVPAPAPPPPAKGKDKWGDGKPAGREPRAAKPKADGGTPTSGRAFFKWCAHREAERKVPLVKGLGVWAAKRGYPERIVDWSPEQVAAGFEAACHRLDQLEPENVSQEAN